MAVGQNVLRKEGFEKLTGAARYVDDITLEGMLFGKTVRSRVPRGRVKTINFDPDYDWSRVVIADYRDIPGENYEALICGEIIYGSDNIFKSFLIARGDVDEGFRQASRVITGEYRVPHQEQLYIETQGMIAIPGEDSLTVMGSMQCPYYVHKAIKQLFNLSDDRAIVIQTTTGGGFGGKEEYPSMIAAHAALLAHK